MLDETINVVDVATNTIVDTLTVGQGPTGKNVFIGPSFVVADGGPLMLASDAELDPVRLPPVDPHERRHDRADGSRDVDASVLDAPRSDGTLDTNGFDATFNGIDLYYGTSTKMGAGTLTLTG